MRSPAYYRRVFQAYFGRRASQLSFWHEQPAIDENAFPFHPQTYYMTFADKSEYAGPFDENGVPLLDYRGSIGRQYNPIAVAQYGLACLRRQAEHIRFRDGFARSARWMAEHLEKNRAGLDVWMHRFDWEYFRPLRAPWYSGLAQGMGLSLMVRAFQTTGESRYEAAADRALAALVTPLDRGGTLWIDPAGDAWIEEYITDPPTHILNGMVWALWGLRDYLVLHPGETRAQELWDGGVATLKKNLARFDTGFWSLYDLSPLPLRNLASPFYHRLHIVQLDVLHRLTGEPVFRETRDRWEGYAASRFRRTRAWIGKALFKLLYF